MNAGRPTLPTSRSQEIPLPGTSRDTAAALRGASIAFSSPRASSRPASASPEVARGALTAANLVGVGSQPASPRSPNTPDRYFLGVPDSQRQSRSPSPSNVAAVLATSKWSSAQKSRDKASRVVLAKEPEENMSERPQNDESSIPPTSSLIKMFEKEGKTAKSPPIISPKPQRALSLSLRLQQEETQNETKGQKPAPPKKPIKLGKQNSGFVPRSPLADPVLTVSDGQRAISPVKLASPPATSPTRVDEEPKKKPIVPAPRRSAKSRAQETSNTNPTSTPQPRDLPSRPLSTPGIRPPPPGKAMSPHMTGDSMANAIVASALASTSHAPSPAPFSPSPRPQAIPGRLGDPRRQKGLPSRTPSPSKRGFRQTLRPDRRSSSSSGDDRYRGDTAMKRVFGRKHPNKHREGSRKRWKDEITEKERKRYEGLWAANKGGPCIISERHQEEVHGLIVRDIWTRSRLPGDVLQDVWELVDTRKEGRLRREEFVVGMWLIDQRLKGRKLPVKVGDSVWSSVRGLGLIVRQP